MNSHDEVVRRMPSTSDDSNRWRTQPMYSYREVSRLSGVSISTVRNWLHGYTNERGVVEPLIREHADDETMCSFLELIEIIVAARFRKAEHKSFRIVRLAYDNATKMFQIQYPFARIELKGIGGHIVHVIRDPKVALQSVDQPESYTIPGLVQQVLDEQIEYEYDLASKWYPAGKDRPIIVDPRISSGMPTIRGRGVTVEAIYDRFKKASQDIEFIARDYDLDGGVVQAAIRLRERVGI